MFKMAKNNRIKRRSIKKPGFVKKWIFIDKKSKSWKYWKKRYYINFILNWIGILFVITALGFLTYENIPVINDLIDGNLTISITHENVKQFNISSQVHFIGDFTKREKRQVYTILHELDPIYTKFVSNITFHEKEETFVKHCSKPDCQGVTNIFTREINMRYYNNERWLHETICHEILHLSFKGGEAFHPAVYDAGRKEVCYL